MPNFLDIASGVVTVPKDGYGSETALNVGPGSLFYKAGSTVSSGSNDGTLTSGSSLSLTGPTSFVAVSQGARLVVSDPQFDEAASLAASVGQPGGVARAGTYGLLANQPTVAAAGDQGTYYATDDNGGTLYQVQSGAWVKVAPRGVELGYAQITSNWAVTTANAAITGLSAPAVTASRPVKVIVDALAAQISAAGNFGVVTILEDGVQIGSITYGVGSANEAYPLHREVRRSPSAGSHTYSVSVQGTGTISTNDRIQASVNSPAFIEVVEV